MIEESGGAVGERRDEVVVVDRTMVLVEDGSSRNVHHGDVALGLNVRKQAAQILVLFSEHATEKVVDDAGRRSENWL